MIRNMGTLDRGLRAVVVAPAAIVAALIFGAGTVGGVILFVVAGIMLVSATAAFCPTYTLVGISTHPRGLHRVGHGIRHGHA
jgi:hypothetical protein